MPRLFAVAAWLASCAAASAVAPLPVWPLRLDAHGDPLPLGAFARLGTLRCRHAGPVVVGPQFSPDGRTIYTCPQNDVPHAWDVSTGRAVARFPGFPEGVRLRVSSDGQLLVGVRNQQMVVRDLRSGRNRVFTLSPHFGSCLAVAPDGRFAAVGSASGSDKVKGIELRDLATGGLVRGLGGEATHCLAFTPDGKTLIAGGRGSLCFWDVAGGQLRRRLFGAKYHQRPLLDLAVTADGKRVVSVAEDARVWDVDTGEELLRYTRHTGFIRGVGVSPDGRRVATTGFDGTLQVWHLADGKLAWKQTLLSVPTGASPVFAPDGRTLAVCDGTQVVHLCDAATGVRLHGGRGHEADLAAVALSPDGRLAATAGHDATLIWDIKEGKILHDGVLPVVRDLVFAPDGRTLAGWVTDTASAEVWLWDVKSGRERRKIAVAGKTDGVVLDQLAFSADGRQVVGLGAAGLFVWDARTGQRLRHDRGFQTVSAIRELSVDGRRVLVESSKGLEKMLAQASTGAGILPGQRFPVSSTFQVLDTATGAELGQRTWRAELVDGQNQLWHWHYLPSGRARPRRSLSPDGRLLLAQTGKEVKLCELASGQVLWSGLWAFPSQGALGADGQTLVVVAPDGTLELADVLSGARRGRWKPPAHHRWALSADGRWLVTVHADTTALVWDVALLAPPPRRPAVLLTAVQREWLWEALAFDDPRTAWAAVERLARDPEGVALVAERLRRLTPPTREHIARLIEALGSQRFADRQAAARELTALGASARANLREALEARPPLELRRRIEAILADGLADRLVRAGEPLRRHRAVLVLERAGTKAARDALTALADGLPHYLTTEARAALARMTNRPRAK